MVHGHANPNNRSEIALGSILLSQPLTQNIKSEFLAENFGFWLLLRWHFEPQSKKSTKYNDVCVVQFDGFTT